MSSNFSAFGIRCLPPGMIVVVGVLTYWNSFQGVFQFDDFKDIVRNPHNHHLGTSLQPYRSAWRPVAWFSMAVNYTLGGEKVLGYHAFNLSVHILAALTLFGVVRRTLLLEPYRQRFQQSAGYLALAAALLWMVHPLQTESVTYIVHRYESLMGLFYLLTLYCAIRGAAPAAWRKSWHVAAVLSCALGMGSKEVMVTAPLVVLLYDRVFLSGSWGQLFRRRWPLHAGLAATWGILASPIWAALTAKEQWAGFGIRSSSPFAYALTQPRVILHYLQLSFWPDSLCVDYGWPLSQGWEVIVPSLALILALLGGTCYALVRIPWLGFLGVWFFGILATTSSFMPILDPAAERRTYLSLAAVVVLAVLAGHALLDFLSRQKSLGPGARAALGGGVAAALVAVLGWLTIQRNRVYYDTETFWRDVVAKRPLHGRGYCNLGIVLLDKNPDALDEAIQNIQEAIDLKPDHTDTLTDAYRALGKARFLQRRIDDAIACYQQALTRHPYHPLALTGLGEIYMVQGRTDAAGQCFSKALYYNPDFAEAHFRMGMLHQQLKNPEEARRYYEEAIRLQPYVAFSYRNLGDLLLQQGQHAEAREYYHKALKLDPKLPEVILNLGNILAVEGKLGEALEYFLQAKQLNPKMPEAHSHLGDAYRKLGRMEEAIASYQEAIRLQPEDVLSHLGLAEALAHVGRFDEAAARAREALALAQSAGQTQLVGQIQEQLQQYQKKLPKQTAPPGETAP